MQENYYTIAFGLPNPLTFKKTKLKVSEHYQIHYWYPVLVSKIAPLNYIF